MTESAATASATWVILNPRSARGRTGQRGGDLLARIRAALGPVELRWTEAPMHAATLARDAIEAGARRVVAVGGDGTVGEAVNGLCEAGADARSGVSLGVLMSGTGGDFRRTLGMPRGFDEQLAVLAAGATREVDVGHLRFTGDDGREATRWYINTASAGMSGEVCDIVNRMTWAKRLGGSVAFNLASLRALLAYPGARMRLSLDDGPATTVRANTIAVCNARYFGGAMHIAPDAELDDGLFDVVTIGDFGFLETIWTMPQLYRGTHVHHRKVDCARAGTVHIEPLDRRPLRLEVDGEAPGQAPVTIENRPRALRVIVPGPEEERG